MKFWRIGLILIGSLFITLSIIFSFSWVQDGITSLFVSWSQVAPQATWPYRFRQIKAVFLILGSAALILGIWVLPAWRRISAAAVRLLDTFDRAVNRSLGGAIDFQSRPIQTSWPAWRAIDWAVLGLFLIYALLCFVGSLQGDYPYIPLRGDAANTATFAAGMDHPELFRGDMLLENTRNVQIYSTFNVFFMRWLTPITGSYSLSLTLLIPIQIFFGLFGFYCFGRILFNHRLWALMLALIFSFTLEINLGEYWGIPANPVARFNFQAALPFVLCMVLLWRDRPKRWPWIMAAVGLMVYLHPVSTPTWAFAIWFSLFLSTPTSWSWRKRLGRMALLGLVFITVALPLVFNYLSSHSQGPSANYELVLTVVTRYFPANLLDIPAAVRDFLPFVTKPAILPLALASLVVLLILPSCRRDLRLVLAWIAGILLSAVLFPWGLHTLERILNRLPLETELVRGIRYLIPFMLLLILWALYELHSRIRYHLAANLAAFTAVLFVAGWWLHTYPPPPELTDAMRCLAQGKILCTPPDDYALAIRAVRENTPPGARIYATFANSSGRSFAMPVRFNALRPLVFSNKDRGMLVYSNGETLQSWYDTFRAIKYIEDNYDDPNPMLKRHLVLARKLGARYLLTDLPFDAEKSEVAVERIVYRNPTFSVIRID